MPDTQNPQAPQEQQPAIQEQPVVQAPAPNYQQPTQAQQQTPYNQQPVQQQYFAQPHAAPVQYVVQAQSLKGLQGWLGFFLVIAGLAALSYAGLLISVLSSSPSSAIEIVNVIFTPLLLAAAVVSVVFLALEKHIARYIYIGFSGLVFLYAIASSATTGDVAAIATGFLTGGLWLTFVILYFLTSKRVKETLVK